MYRSFEFSIAMTLLGLIAAGVAVPFTDGPNVGLVTRIDVPVLAGATSVAIALLAVLVMHSVAAPLRQRNELRQGWPVGPIEQPVNLGLALREYHRRGAVLVAAGQDIYTRKEEAKMDAWIEKVSTFRPPTHPRTSPVALSPPARAGRTAHR